MSNRLATAKAQSFRRELAAFADKEGYSVTKGIPEDMTFRAWCEDLGRRGLKVDKKPFRLDNRPALLPIYDAIPTTRAEAAGGMLTIQKATQLGLTVWEVLADIYMARKWAPVNIGLFLPDQATASFKSEQRFMPIIRSAPDLLRQVVYRSEPDGTQRYVGEGNVLTRQIGDSLLMFLWTSGRVTTESRPMDIVSLDEVQEMSLAAIDKVMARTGDSDVGFSLLLSTANMPEMDINFWYLLGTQEVWHTLCRTCGTLSDLSDPALNFPHKAIAFNAGQVPPAATHDGSPPVDPPRDEYVWTCPHCQHHIPDPQIGEYVTQNPRVSIKRRSLMLPRTISPRQTPRMMYEAWGRSKTGDQKKSFYNRTLARPYIDADQLPVTLAHCKAAAEEGMALGLVWEKSGAGYYMGIDQMGGFNAVIIKKRLPDARQGVVHVEAVFDINPFKRCAELMEQYRIALCVVEQLPNVNDARRFSNQFPGRVYLTTAYQDLGADYFKWGDQLDRSDRKTEAEERTRYTVTVNQYKTMQAALYRIRDRMCLFPDPAALEQDVMDDGEPKRVHLLQDWVFMHFTKTALVVEVDDETRKLKPKVKKVGLDPHFSYANMLCDVAWARTNGMSSMMIPTEATATASTRAKAVERAMPGLPQHVVAMISDVPEGTCGRCKSFAAGQCTERGFSVGATDPACVLYSALPRAGA